MQQLWGMIRAMQTIILAGLIDIPMPAHALVFMKGCMSFAQMDVFDGSGLYAQVFDFKPTEPLTPNFESFGISDKNFMMNSGSYFIFFISFFVINGSLFLINKISVWQAHRSIFRKIGMKVYSNSYWGDTKYSSLKLYMESYFDLTMCSFLGYLAFSTDSTKGGIGEFMENYSDITNSLVTIVYLVMGFIFVIVGLTCLYKNRKDLQSNQFNHSMRVYFEGVRNSSLSKMMYNLVFLSRRLITGLVLVLLSPYPYF